MAQTSAPVEKLAISEWRTWLAAYAFLLALLHQVTYWSAFNVNATSYMGLQDIIRLAVPALLVSAVGVLAMTFFVRLTSPLERWPSRKRGRAALVLLLLVLLPGLTLMAWNSSIREVLYIIGAVIVAAIAYFGLEMSDRFAATLPEPWRTLLIVGLAFGPVLSVGRGMGLADQIKQGIHYSQGTVADGVGIGLCDPTWPADARYIGKINDYFFFFVDKETCVVRSDALPAFRLRTHVAPVRIRIPVRDEPAWRVDPAPPTT